ncbi:MAG: phasin family protein [Candidatus Alcyoniella australis]|nr:phasin family protein [Candidatus Alcyoniella australis]
MAQIKISQVREGVKTALKPLANLEERFKEIVEKIQSQKVKTDDLPKVLNELTGKLKKARSEFERSFSDGLTQMMGAINVATKADIDAIDKKIDKLAKQMAKLQAPSAKKAPVKKAVAKKAQAKKPVAKKKASKK